MKSSLFIPILRRKH